MWSLEFISTSHYQGGFKYLVPAKIDPGMVDCVPGPARLPYLSKQGAADSGQNYLE